MKRVKQFVNCIFARVNDDDIEFINKYLNEEEKKIIFKLPRYDVKHAVNVAMDIYNNSNKIKSEYSNIDIDEMIKIGLLHDSGKIIKKLNPIDKSIMVIADHISKGNMKKYEGISKKIYIYYNHGEEGYKRLSVKGIYNNDFLDTIRYHHSSAVKSDMLHILRKYDDIN